MVFGAMSAYAIAYHSGSPWLGVFAAAVAGVGFGAVHGLLCSLPRVNDTAVGISLIVLGLGLAFFLGRDYVQPTAPRLPSIPLGSWSENPALRAALQINVLFVIGLALAVVLHWAFRNTRWGLRVRTVGDSADAARALGLPVARTRVLATALGGCLGGVGGAYLSLYYPGSWNESLSSGQGVMAVALVIFARWSPLGCLRASLIFGGASSIGPALQSVGIQAGYHLWNAAPYELTLAIRLIGTSTSRATIGAPGELSMTR
jgi:simple sugar transport system permease protein